MPSRPEMGLAQEALDFGVVRVRSRGLVSLEVSNSGRVPLAIVAAVLEDDPARPNGAGAFRVVEVPEAFLERAELKLAFEPADEGEFRARLRLVGDDPDPERSTRTISLVGRAARSRLEVAAACEAPCSGFGVSGEPPGIDFGARPRLRPGAAGLFGEPAWPTVRVRNAGEVPVTLSWAGFRGDPAFAALESLDAAGLELLPGAQRTVHVTFDPADATGPSFRGELVVATEDQDLAEARVALRGELLPNEPPRVCAAVVEAIGPDGAVLVPVDADGTAAFGGPVAIQPGTRSQIRLSAFSDHFTARSPGTCTTDLEDGRDALRLRWAVLERPAQSEAELAEPSSPEPTFSPDAAGRYRIGLTATDPLGASSSTEVAFDAFPRRDLAAQLSWTGQRAVDLDVHLAKSGPCGTRPECVFAPGGDASVLAVAADDGLDWGEPGKFHDDPRLDLDDQGDGALIETVSLNYPENDPACETSPCSYEVYVHVFKDWRAESLTAPSCPGKPCFAGTTCGCASGAVCVSDRCVSPLRPELELFVKPTPASPTAALRLPAPGEVLELPGPCTLWHVARVTWPSRAELRRDPDLRAAVTPIGAPGARELAFYGTLRAGSLSCAPNGPPGGDASFLPESAPLYR